MTHSLIMVVVRKGREQTQKVSIFCRFLIQKYTFFNMYNHYLKIYFNLYLSGLVLFKSFIDL